MAEYVVWMDYNFPFLKKNRHEEKLMNVGSVLGKQYAFILWSHGFQIRRIVVLGCK